MSTEPSGLDFTVPDSLPWVAFERIPPMATAPIVPGIDGGDVPSVAGGQSACEESGVTFAIDEDRAFSLAADCIWPRPCEHRVGLRWPSLRVRLLARGRM